MNEDLHGMHKVLDVKAVPGIWYTHPPASPLIRIQPISFPSAQIHTKAWGSETWVINTPLYCAKILTFGAGKSFSDHYHWVKDECWYVVKGKLLLELYNLGNAARLERIILPGEVIHVPPGNPHKLTALEDSIIYETSTTHDEGDSYRIGKGDSQK